MGGVWGARRGVWIFGFALAVALCVPSAIPSASAAASGCTTSWKSPVDGVWSVAANWTNGVPSSSSVACVSVAGTYTVSVVASLNVGGSLWVGAATGTQTVTLSSTCDADAYLTLGQGAVIGSTGALLMPRPAGCAGPSGVLTGGTVANYGTIEADGQFNAGLVNHGVVHVDNTWGSVVGHDWTNDGTIAISSGVQLLFGTYLNSLTNNGAIVASGTGTVLMEQGTFIEGTGTTTGSVPVVVQDGKIDYAGSGKSTIEAAGEPTLLVGNLAAQQTLLVPADCNTAHAQIVSTANWTSRGTIVLSGKCGGNAALSGPGTFTNLGTVRMSESVELESNVSNQGLIALSASRYVVNTYGAEITNTATGTVAVDIDDASHFSRVLQAGWKLLGGTLSINTKSTFWPTSGARFRIATSGTSTGAFKTVVGATRTGQTIAYHVQYATDGFFLSTS